MIRRRYREVVSLLPFGKLKPCHALRERLRDGYTAADLRADLMSGAVVGLVAIPLGMALAIASGVAPQNGLYTVIIGGGVVALLGGSRFQVTGPTAAFVVLLAPVAQKFGLGGLLVAGLMAGCLLLVMGLCRFGRLIEFIPYPVTTGFTSGIAVVIATLQMKDFFGLQLTHVPETYFGRVAALFQARGTFAPAELAVGAATLAMLIGWQRINKKIPSPLVALSLVTLGTVLLKHLYPDWDIATIGTRFSTEVDGRTIRGIPPTLPGFAFPWSLPGGDGTRFEIGWKVLNELMPSAFAIAMLGAIESLLSAVVADGMTRTKHDPDAELVALGVGNMLCPFFGGIAATGAIARTATNIRFGARSPISAILHAGFVLFVVILFAPVVSYLPMAALAALLLMVAYNMSEVRHFAHIVKVSPRSDVVVLLLCFSLTVVFDMVVGVTVGVMLAALLFMKRMASLTQGRLAGIGGGKPLLQTLPNGVLVYEIAGPLFFGAANRAIEALSLVSDEVKCVIFDLSEVPAMDATGLVALESAIRRLSERKVRTVLAEVQHQPATLLSKAQLFGQFPSLEIYKTLKEAVALASGVPPGRNKPEAAAKK